MFTISCPETPQRTLPPPPSDPSQGSLISFSRSGCEFAEDCPPISNSPPPFPQESRPTSGQHQARSLGLNRISKSSIVRAISSSPSIFSGLFRARRQSRSRCSLFWSRSHRRIDFCAMPQRYSAKGHRSALALGQLPFLRTSRSRPPARCHRRHDHPGFSALAKPKEDFPFQALFVPLNEFIPGLGLTFDATCFSIRFPKETSRSWAWRSSCVKTSHKNRKR